MFLIIIYSEALCVAWGLRVRSLLGSDCVSIVDKQNYFRRKWGQCPGDYQTTPEGLPSACRPLSHQLSKYPHEEERKEDANGVLKWYKALS